ncbi:c-type cytochrome [Cyclobacterium plantarum]|uniref:c-type cytochrome n=1 Tax=Cyclobacterium plantarum TaxID=2716263 RepID=UPI003F6F327F
MEEKKLYQLLHRLTLWIKVLALGIIGSGMLILVYSLGIYRIEPQQVSGTSLSTGRTVPVSTGSVWQAPLLPSLPSNPEADLIRYGHELIAHTALYLGPKGKVRQISNGMNCQNCHLKAGTVPYGNNYGLVASKYPAFRNRSGTVESFEKRINDCIERSLNGQPLDPESKEMKAMVSYMKWVGKDITKENQNEGFGLLELPIPEQAADPVKGKTVYDAYCTRCHGENGEGVLAENGLEYTYPPLFGSNSYNKGAGLYRISRFAAFVKANMPYGVSYDTPFLSDEEAWNVAAYVNSMPRPEIDLSEDWPDLSKKPFDHPFGPYTDNFPENQHKFGPFGPILLANQ